MFRSCTPTPLSCHFPLLALPTPRFFIHHSLQMAGDPGGREIVKGANNKDIHDAALCVLGRVEEHVDLTGKCNHNDAVKQPFRCILSHMFQPQSSSCVRELAAVSIWL